MTHPHQFLESAIRAGFNTLRVARMKFVVRKEEQQDTINAWILMMINDCNWNEKDDLKRITEAFKFIARNDHEFPTIARFIEVLEHRSPIPAHHQIEFKKPILTESQKKEIDKGWQNLRDLANQIRSNQL